MSDKTLILLGAGGHAKVCYEIALEMNHWNKIIVLDDNSTNDFFEISGTLSDYNKYPNDEFFVAIGNNEIRKKIITELIDNDLKLTSLIHPKAIVSKNSIINYASVIMAGVVINSSVVISRGCIINTASVIEHDCRIGDFSHISPGTHLAGNVNVGNLCWTGIGSVIINNINVCDNVIIGAGAVVVTNIIKEGIYIGIPAKINK